MKKLITKMLVVLEFESGGKIYLDPFARKDKKSGAWMNDYQGLNGNQQANCFCSMQWLKANKIKLPVCWNSTKL
jgi:Zn-dependent oligopeptidase